MYQFQFNKKNLTGIYLLIKYEENNLSLMYK